MPAPERKSDLPVGCAAPLNLEEAALRIEEMLAVGDATLFQPIPTGFLHFDRLMGGGLRGGDLHIIGGAQNIGKTAMLLQIAARVASEGALALVVCYEHGVQMLWERLLCQSSHALHGEHRVSAVSLSEAYLAAVGERGGVAIGENRGRPHMLDEVIRRVPGGIKAWSRMAEIAQNLWLVSGDGLFTSVDALAQYLQFAFRPRRRVVLFIDYLQQVPVPGTERPLEVEERIERVLRGLKGLALRYFEAGKVLPIVAVAAVDGQGLRGGRVHAENLWGGAAIQYEPDVIWIGNREGASPAGEVIIRWAVEKNRRGPSDLEFRHRYHGAAYSFDLVGEPVPAEESWQSERLGVPSRLTPSA